MQITPPTDFTTPLAAFAPLAPAPAPAASDTPPELPPQVARVLHVINGEHFSGAERVQDLLAMRLPHHGFGVGFVALKAGRFGDVRQSLRTPLAELSMAGKWDLRAAGFVARMARDGGYDLLHAHTPRTAMIASLAARRLGLPLVYHVHSPTSRDSTRRFSNWINDRVERWSIGAAAKLITVSPTLTDHMQSHGVAAERLTCVLNGVPAIGGAAPRTAPTGDWTLGMVALFRPRKGVELLLEALAAVRARGQRVRLRMIGPFETREYEDRITALAHELAVDDAITWTGFTDNVARELAQVDALALPSLFGEGLPMVVLEAMAAGLPVIATRCEGVEQAVIDRQTGLLVDAGSVGELCRAVEELVTEQVDYAALSQASLARHAAEFSDDIMAARVAEVYREVLEK